MADKEDAPEGVNSKIVLESPMMVSLVCGGNFVTVGPSGVDIKGIMVNVNSGGSKGSGSAIKPAGSQGPQGGDEERRRLRHQGAGAAAGADGVLAEGEQLHRGGEHRRAVRFVVMRRLMAQAVARQGGRASSD